MRLSHASYGVACLALASAYPYAGQTVKAREPPPSNMEFKHYPIPPQNANRYYARDSVPSTIAPYGTISQEPTTTTTRSAASSSSSASSSSAVPSTTMDPTLIDMRRVPEEVRDKIYKNCSDPLVKDASQDPKKIWDGLGCKLLANSLGINASEEAEDSKLTYVGRMSIRMGGPEGWDCGNIDGQCNGDSLQCFPPFACGYKIMKSLSKIHHIYEKVNDHLKQAHDELQDVVAFSFKDTFAPKVKKEDNTIIADVIVGVASLGALGAGTVADTLVKNSMKAFKDSQPQVKDGMMLAAGAGTPLALNEINKDNLAGKSVDSKLSDLLLQVFDALKKEHAKTLKTLFNGSSDSRLALYYMMNDGAMLDMTKDVNFDEIENEIQKIFLAMIIPKAWAIAPSMQNGKNDAYSNPFFINTNQPCGKKPKAWKSITSGKSFTEICYNDEAWFLMVVHVYRDTKDPADLNAKWTWSLTTPPGNDELVSENGYFNLTAKDMLASAYGGWLKGGRKQYWKMPTDKKLLSGDGPATYELNYSGRAREPGLVQMLVATNWGNTIGRIKKLVHNTDADEGHHPSIPTDWPGDN